MKKKTQEQQVLSHLKRYKRITSMQAFSKYHITRLSAVVFDLRKAGYPITTERKASNGSTYAIYRLEKEA